MTFSSFHSLYKIISRASARIKTWYINMIQFLICWTQCLALFIYVYILCPNYFLIAFSTYSLKLKLKIPMLGWIFREAGMDEKSKPKWIVYTSTWSYSVLLQMTEKKLFILNQWMGVTCVVFLNFVLYVKFHYDFYQCHK